MGVDRLVVGGTGVERLTDAECRSVKPDVKVRKLSDGKGLFLAVMPTGGKLWRMKYRLAGKERTYSIGPYPEVTLASAREECDKARGWLRDGKDPVIARKVQRAGVRAEQATTFRVIADEWLVLQPYSAGHRAHQRALLDNDLLPYLGALPVAEITPAIVLETLRKVERRGALETAAKCRRMTSAIFRYAVQTSRATADPAALLAGAIKTPDTKHRATVPAKEMPALLKAMAAVPAEINTKLRVLLAAAHRRAHRGDAVRHLGRDREWQGVAHPGRAHEDAQGAPGSAVDAGAASAQGRCHDPHQRRRRGAAVPRFHSARRAVRECSARADRPRRILRPADCRMDSAQRSAPGRMKCRRPTPT